jgi:hypothetical protein
MLGRGGNVVEVKEDEAAVDVGLQGVRGGEDDDASHDDTGQGRRWWGRWRRRVAGAGDGAHRQGWVDLEEEPLLVVVHFWWLSGDIHASTLYLQVQEHLFQGLGLRFWSPPLEIV